MNKNRYLVKVQDYDIDGKEIELLVKQTQENFKDKKMRGEEGMVSYCYKLSKEMVIEIAKKFFPESKHPLMEISIDEALLLSTYVTKRLEELLDHKGLRLFRKLKISTIYGWTEVKTTIDENAIEKSNKQKLLACLLNRVSNDEDIVDSLLLDQYQTQPNKEGDKESSEENNEDNFNF